LFLLKDDDMIEKTLIVKNRAGIHARPAALIAQTANKFNCELTLVLGDTEVNAKSIMGVITMAAGYNTSITLKADGSDEKEAVQAIEALFDSKFAEE
jgi:phosphocarrier protein HPr